jgi:hypothetical protein
VCSNINIGYPQHLRDFAKSTTYGSKTFLATEKNWFKPGTKKLPNLPAPDRSVWGDCDRGVARRGWGVRSLIRRGREALGQFTVLRSECAQLFLRLAGWLRFG